MKGIYVSVFNDFGENDIKIKAIKEYKDINKYLLYYIFNKEIDDLHYLNILYLKQIHNKINYLHNEIINYFENNNIIYTLIINKCLRNHN